MHDHNQNMAMQNIIYTTPKPKSSKN